MRLEVRDDDFLKRCCQELCQTLQLSQEPRNSCFAAFHVFLYIIAIDSRFLFIVSFWFKYCLPISYAYFLFLAYTLSLNSYSLRAPGALPPRAPGRLDGPRGAEPVDRSEPRRPEDPGRATPRGPRAAGGGARGAPTALQEVDLGAQGARERVPRL